MGMDDVIALEVDSAGSVVKADHSSLFCPESNHSPCKDLQCCVTGKGVGILCDNLSLLKEDIQVGVALGRGSG